MPDGIVVDVQEMLLHVVQSLVDKPEEVRIQLVPDGASTTYRVHADASDVGKLIGASGRTARALRVILCANAARLKRDLRLDIVETHRAAV